MMVFLLFAILSFAQEGTKKHTGISVGYFGETLTHAGFTIGIEHSPFSTEGYQMLLALNVGGYTHVRNNTSLFVRSQLGQRVIFNNGIFFDHFIGLGYLHQFTHGGDHFQVLPNGAVIETPDSGNAMIMPSIALGTGYEFSDTLKMYVRPEVFWKAPFNGYYLTNFAMNIGLIFKI